MGDLTKARLEDWGQDLALHPDHKQCGLRLAELGAMGCGIDYAKVGNGLSEFEAAHSDDPKRKEKVDCR